MNAWPDSVNASENLLSVALVLGSVSYRAGGLFNSVRSTAQAIAKSGHEVATIAIDDKPAEEDLAAWLPVKPLLMPSKGPTSLGYAPGIRRVLASQNFNIVHQHGIWQAFSRDVSFWKRCRGCPVLISPRGMLDPWALATSTWKKRVAAALYEDRNLHGADCLHALNSTEAASMRAFGLRNPIAIIPNGVSLPRHHINCSKPSLLRDDDRKILLFLGRLHPKKGIQQTLEAWSFLKSSNPELFCEWRLVIAGWDDDGYGEELVAHARQRGLSNDVTFLGPVFGEEKDALLTHAEAFILASFSEGMPMAVLEAWSHKLPVFMTNECNLTEGFAAEAAIALTNDPAGICRTLAQSLGSPQLAEIGCRGRRLVEQKFTWDSIMNDLLNVYHWLAFDCERPDCVTDT